MSNVRNVQHGKLLYEKKFACIQDIKDFRLEGSAKILNVKLMKNRRRRL